MGDGDDEGCPSLNSLFWLSFLRGKKQNLCVCCVVLCYKRWCWWLLRVVQVKRDPSIHWCVYLPPTVDYPNLFWAAAAGGPVDSHVTFDPKELERVGCVCTQCSWRHCRPKKIKLFQLFYTAGFDYDYLDELILSWILLWLPKEFK